MFEMAVEEVTALMRMITEQRDRRKKFAGNRKAFLAQPAEKSACLDIIVKQRQIENRYGFSLKYEPLV